MSRAPPGPTGGSQKRQGADARAAAGPIDAMPRVIISSDECLHGKTNILEGGGGAGGGDGHPSADGFGPTTALSTCTGQGGLDTVEDVMMANDGKGGKGGG